MPKPLTAPMTKPADGAYLDQLVRYYAGAIFPSVDSGTQTRVSGRAGGRAPLDMGAILSRLHLSIPLLQRTLMD